jgi:two-component system, cell cycle response regulator
MAVTGSYSANAIPYYDICGVKMPTVLIADDSRFQVQLLATALKERGYSTLIAEDTLQAGMLALRTLPDAIVLDVNMPGGSGIEVLKRLKRSTKTQNIPVIIVSGSCDADVADVARQLGAAEFLPKPVDVDQLCSTLMRLISAMRRSARVSAS